MPGLTQGKGPIMADETNIGKTELTSPSRREIVTKATQVAVTAPAVALLLNASAKSAFAQVNPYVNHILDDFTFGNNEEDVDAITLGSNFSPNNGKPQQDDHV
jgi:hypothetical protein